MTQQRIKSRLGYNINAANIPDMNHLIDHLRKVRPAVLVVMNSLEVADMFYQMFEGECLVVARDWSPLEGYEWWYTSPGEFVQRWRDQGYKHLIRYTTNEPGWGKDTPLAKYIEHEVAVAELARKYGFTVALGNFGVGRIEPHEIGAASIYEPHADEYRFTAQEVEEGQFDDLLHAIYDYGHYLAVHEYALAALPSGVGLMHPEALLDPAKMQPEQWPRKEAVDQVRREPYPPFWHLLRSQWLARREDRLGIPRSSKLVLEAGWDVLWDQPHVTDELKRRNGGDVRGINTLPSIWDWYWPQWDTAEAAYNQLAWMDAIYPEDEYRGFALFTWSTHKHWEAYDYSRLYELQALLEQHTSPAYEQQPDEAPLPTPTPPDVPAWTEIEAMALHPLGANLRAEPDIDADVIGVLPQRVTRCRANLERFVDEDGYKWLQIESTDGVTAWVASEVIAYRRADETVPLPAETFDILPYLRGVEGDYYTLENTWSSGIEYLRTIQPQQGYWMQVKNRLSETYGVDGEAIKAYVDTSPHGGERYRVMYDLMGNFGATYLPRMVRVGGIYKEEALLEWRSMATGEVIGKPEMVTYWHRVVGIERTWTTPAGVTLNNVLVIEDYDADPATGARPFERKRYKRGLRGWQGLERSQDLRGESYDAGAFDCVAEMTCFEPTEPPNAPAYPHLPVAVARPFQKANAVPLILGDGEVDPVEPEPPVPDIDDDLQGCLALLERAARWAGMTATTILLILLLVGCEVSETATPEETQEAATATAIGSSDPTPTREIWVPPPPTARP